MKLYDLFVSVKPGRMKAVLGPAWRFPTERGVRASKVLKARRHEYIGTITDDGQLCVRANSLDVVCLGR